MTRIGATVDQADPLVATAERGGDAAQILLGDPQSWGKPEASYPGGAAALGKDAAEQGVRIYVHSAYVINVASANNRIRIPSRKLLQQSLTAAAELGAAGLVVHGGHVTKDDDPEAGFDNWRKCVEGLELPIPLLIENTAGGNHAMARYLEAIEKLWAAVGQTPNADRIGFCLDTCHAFAAGLELDTVVEKVLGITGRIDLVHANDSQGGFASGRDRHANFGKGKIEPEQLATVAVAAAAAGADFVCETPGDAADQGADVAWLRERIGAKSA
ncbi:MAG TPA: deoxyribonuclease IV [Actinospica sp.]|nr:deoxyribonuclease IV [Actinospica sp.]